MTLTTPDPSFADDVLRKRRAPHQAGVQGRGPAVAAPAGRRPPSAMGLSKDDPAAANRTATFVGRDVEFRRLGAAAELARRGIATSVAVEGGPGIGKTALVDRFAASCPGFRVLAVTATQQDSGEPDGLLSPLLTSLPGSGEPTPDRLDGDHVAVSLTLMSALSAAAADAPLMLIVDDMHLAHPHSQLALRFAVRRLTDARVLTILAGHPGDDDGHSNVRQGASDIIRLDGLGPAAIDGLVRLVTGRSDAELAAHLTGWTGGNPALIWALLTDRDFLADPGRTVPAAGLVGALRTMIAQFPEPSRTVLAALSVMRNPAEATMVSAVSGLEEIDSAARSLVSARMVAWTADPAGRPALAFVTASHRDAVYQTLGIQDRRLLHLAASKVVGESEVYDHLIRAGADPDEEMATRLDVAADAEAAGGDFGRAARYAWRAAELSASAEGRELRLTKAVRMLVRAGHDGVALTLRPSVEELPPSWRREEAVALLAFARGEPVTAGEALRRAERDCPSTLPGDRARLAAELATVAGYLCAGPDAVTAARRATRISDHPEILGITTAMESFGRALIDGPAAGLTPLNRIPHEPTSVIADDLPALTIRGVLRGLTGALPSAIADLTVASRRRASARLAVLGLSAHIHLATSQFLAGNLPDAEQTLCTAIELAPAYGRQLDRAAIHSTLAVLHSWQGDAAAAVRDLNRSVELSRTGDSQGPLFHQRIARGVLAWVAADHRAAVAALAPLLEPASDEQRTRLYGIWWLPMLGAAQLDANMIDDAVMTIRRIADLDASGPLRDTVVAWLTGRLALARGETTNALQVLSAARTEFRYDGNIYVGHLVEALAEARHRAGEESAANDTFADAMSNFAAIGAIPFLNRCRERRDRRIEPVGRARMSGLPDLTAKEQLVAELVAKGRTNREIAQELYISSKTVEYHVRNSCNKLGITGRRELRDLIQQSQAPAA